mgnify:CR=1 FL=1
MAKYIPAKSYIGSSEVATDFNVTGPSTFSNTLTVGEDDTGYDVKFFGATSGRYMLWDESDDRLEFTDNTKISFGTGSDLQIYHDGTNSYISQESGDVGYLYIRNTKDDGDIYLQSDDGAGGVAHYFYLDGSVGFNRFPYPVIVEDSVNLNCGTGQDMQLVHNGTDSKIDNNTGDLYISNNTNDKDIILRSDDGSGGVTAYLTLDGSATTINIAKNMEFADSVIAKFGTDRDLQIQHDGTNGYIHNYTGDLYIQNGGDDKDIILRSDDGSGGLATYFYLDGSGTRTIFEKLTRHDDNVYAAFGTDSDLRIYHDGSNSYIKNLYGGDLYIQNSLDDKDIIFSCDDGSGGVETYFYLDGSLADGTWTYTTWVDGGVINLGDDRDLQLYHDGTDSTITNKTGDLYITNRLDDKDIILRSDDGSGGVTAYLTLDGSRGFTTAQKNIRMGDSVELELGTDGDGHIIHTGSAMEIENNTGDLTINQEQNDGDIIFLCDNGSGGTTSYLTLDGGNVSVNILTQKVIMANLPTSDPVVDGQLWNDNGTLKVSAGE